MSTIQNVGGTTATASGANVGAAALQETQDRFIKLLVTQMKNQDPLNPLDNAQVTSQMAQLSTVTGINKLNDTVSALSTSFLAGQSLQAASLVGHSVMIPGNQITLNNGTAVGGVSLPQAVDGVVVNIKDASGQIVHSVDLGPQQGGVLPFQWDGKTDSGSTAANGTYTFDVVAAQGGKKVDATALSVAPVASVSLGAQGPMLNVVGFGPVALSQVLQII